MRFHGNFDVVSWATPNDHHQRDDILACKGLRLIESDNVNRYHWVTGKIVRTLSILNTIEVVTKADITVGNPSDWSIVPIGPEKRICSSFERILVYLYECIFIGLRICLSFSDFEVAIMDHLKLVPSRCYPEA